MDMKKRLRGLLGLWLAAVILLSSGGALAATLTVTITPSEAESAGCTAEAYYADNKEIDKTDVKHDETVILEATSVPGWEFKSWDGTYTYSGNIIDLSITKDSTSPTTASFSAASYDMTVTATFAKMDVTVAFYKNDGSGASSSETVSYGGSVTPTADKFTREGGYFIEKWTTSADGTGVTYNNDTPIVVTTNLNLYAQWKQTAGYTVEHQFELPDGGTHPFTQTGLTGIVGETTSAVPLNGAGINNALGGLTGQGLSHEAYGAPAITQVEITSGGAKATIRYPLRSFNVSTLIKPTGSGTVAVNGSKTSPVSVKFGDTVTLAATPTEGYTFKEWSVTGGGVTIVNNSFTMPAKDVEVTANFTKGTSRPSGGSGGSCREPVVTSPAAHQSVPANAGSPATMGVTALNGDTYQWYVDTGDGNFRPISGATGPSYTTPALTLEDNGNRYYARVCNPCGCTLSHIFTLDVALVIPKTGDSSRTWLWAGLIAASLAGLAYSALARRRRKA